MNTLLQKLIEREIHTHEVVACIVLYCYTDGPSPREMAERWGVPELDIHRLYHKIVQSGDVDRGVLLFKSILYMVEAGIYTNLSHVLTKLNEI